MNLVVNFVHNIFPYSEIKEYKEEQLRSSQHNLSIDTSRSKHLRRKSNVAKTEKTMEIAEIVNKIVTQQIRQRNSIVRTHVSYACYTV